MKRVLLALFVGTLMLFAAPARAAEPRLYATTGEIRAMVFALDPPVDGHFSTDWYRSMDGTGQDAGVYGYTLPWYHAIYLRGDALPLEAYKHIMAHEWSHMLQYRIGAHYDVNEWQGFMDRMDAEAGLPPGSTDGIEKMADCMADYVLSGYGPYCVGKTALTVHSARVMVAHWREGQGVQQ